MKKIIMFTMLLLATLPVMADDLTAKEKGFRNQVLSYIRQEGYAPSIDETDGSIEFKYQGRTYWVSVAEYKNGYYIDIYSGVVINEDQYASAIIAANKATRDYRFLRAFLTADNEIVYVKMGGYFTTIYPFKDVFNSWLELVSEKRLEIFNSL